MYEEHIDDEENGMVDIAQLEHQEPAEEVRLVGVEGLEGLRPYIGFGGVAPLDSPTGWGLRVQGPRPNHQDPDWDCSGDSSGGNRHRRHRHLAIVGGSPPACCYHLFMLRRCGLW